MQLSKFNAVKACFHFSQLSFDDTTYRLTIIIFHGMLMLNNDISSMDRYNTKFKRKGP